MMPMWAMDLWAVTSSITGDRLTKLLKKGWEPFGVFEGEVWLRLDLPGGEEGAALAGYYTARDALKLGEPTE